MHRRTIKLDVAIFDAVNNFVDDWTPPTTSVEPDGSDYVSGVDRISWEYSLGSGII